MTDAIRHTVLVVDDEENNRRLIQRMLMQWCRVVTAENGHEALERVRRGGVDLVLLDVMMPGLDGFETCRRIKAEATDGFLPVVLVTALQGQEDRNAGISAGANEFLAKPVHARELRLRVKALLRVRDQDRTIREQGRSLRQANRRLTAVQRLGRLLFTEAEGTKREAASELIARELEMDLAAICRPQTPFEPLEVAPESAREAARALALHPATQRCVDRGEPQSEGGPRGFSVWCPIRDSAGTLGVLIGRTRRPVFAEEQELQTMLTLSFQLAPSLRERELDEKTRSSSAMSGARVRERNLELEHQNRFLRLVIDSLPVSLYVVDRERVVVAWNRRRELGKLGLPREEALGRNLVELFGAAPAGTLAELDRAFTGERLSVECESAVGDDVRYFRLQRLPMRLDDERVTHVLTVGEEITEQRRLEQSLATTEKMVAIGRIAAGVAHEVNNPLATIVSCAEALSGRVADLPAEVSGSADFREYLEIMQQEAFRARKITGDLLDFSRSRASARHPQSLEPIVERTLLILKHHDGFGRVEIERRFEPNLPDVDVEEQALVQVLVALVINALDAMPEGGTLTLATRAVGGEVCCDVRDSGCGVPPAALPRIFEPFYTTKPVGRGTGLGLSVCYGIMRSHDGRIDVDSTPGAGSTFTIVLPAVEAERIQEIAG